MKLFYRKYGSGKPVLILHGLLGMSDNWVEIGKKLAANYSIFIPDLRNHGQSPHDSVFNFQTMSDDIAELLCTLKLKQVSIVGHSMGGKVALCFANRYPDSVEKLVIADIGLKTNSVDDFVELLKNLITIKPEKYSQRSDIEKEIQKLNIEEKVKQLLFKNIRRVEQNQYTWKINIPVFFKNISKISGGLCLNSKIDKPTLFIYSGLSHYVTNVDFFEIKETIPQATFVKFENATHWLHADCPNEFIKEVNRFLK